MFCWPRHVPTAYPSEVRVCREQPVCKHEAYMGHEFRRLDVQVALTPSY